MSLARKDAKPYFDADIHAAIKDFADVDGVTMGEFIEAIVAPVVRKRMHDTIELAARFRRAGITGDGQESQPGEGVTGTRERRRK